MMKNYSLAFIMGLLCLIIGFLYGRYSNEIGRYTFKDYSDGFFVFDSSTGVFIGIEKGQAYRRDIISEYKIQEEKKAKTKKNK
ncbi:hypothetical protein [Kaistella sp.]|uniref:hypothetical protein n=1 Tax=Kaistella sp. TaxID=2782235 RepID=UPI002F95FE04